MSRRMDEYDEELREHIEIETRENIARGMSPEAARREAIRAFGNASSVRQQLREGGPFYWFETLIQDVRYGLRLIKRSPLLAFAIVLTLTLGIGINTGVFTILNGSLLRARVEKDPDTFAQLNAQYSGDVGRVAFDTGFSITDFRAYQANSRSLENIGGWGVGRTVIGRDDPAQWLTMTVTCNFFSLYGLDHPRLGRLFRAEECIQPGANPVVVISEELWRSTFGADPAVVGTDVLLNHQAFTVIGITPARFSGQLRGPGIWVPYTMQASFYNGHDFFRDSSVPWLVVEGRLKPGQTRASVQAELAVIAQQQDRLQPGRKTTLFVTNGSFIQSPSERKAALWLGPLVMGALTLVLILACTNVTMLMLSRATARQREIAIRLSLGAARMRLMRMLLTESLILAGFAGAISAWIAYQVPKTMERLIPGMPHYPLDPDMGVFAYLAAVTLLAGVIAAMAPAGESLKVDLTASLKGLEGYFGPGRSRSRSVLIVTQVALSFVLLAGAALFVRAEFTIFAADPRFETRQVMQFTPRTPAPVYIPATAAAFYHTLEQRLNELPGIQSVCFASSPPFSNDEGNGPMEEIRMRNQAKGTGLKASVNIVSSEFFNTLGIPIVLGRPFHRGEAPLKGTAAPIVVSEALARTLWAADNPLGRLLQDADGDSLEVVGVARDIKSQRFGAVDGPLLYRLRDPNAYGDTVLTRFRGDAAPLQLAIRGLLRNMDREMTPRIGTLRSVMDQVAALFWNVAEVVLLLGMVAVTLAVCGIYGVVAFAVSRRTREMGVRMALGATRADIIQSVLRSGAKPILIGLAAGLSISMIGAFALAQALRATPIGINVTDPVAYLSVLLLLALTAVAAMFGPAWRASRFDPSSALRQD